MSAPNTASPRVRRAPDLTQRLASRRQPTLDDLLIAPPADYLDRIAASEKRDRYRVFCEKYWADVERITRVSFRQTDIHVPDAVVFAVCQDVLAKVALASDGLRPGEDIRPYINTTVGRYIRNLKQRSHRARALLCPDISVDDQPEQYSEGERREARQLLNEVIREAMLTEREEKVLWARISTSDSIQTVADRLELTYSQVETAASHALEKVRAAIGRNKISHDAFLALLPLLLLVLWSLRPHEASASPLPHPPSPPQAPGGNVHDLPQPHLPIPTPGPFAASAAATGAVLLTLALAAAGDAPPTDSYGHGTLNSESGAAGGGNGEPQGEGASGAGSLTDASDPWDSVWTAADGRVYYFETPSDFRGTRYLHGQVLNLGSHGTVSLDAGGMCGSEAPLFPNGCEGKRAGRNVAFRCATSTPGEFLLAAGWIVEGDAPILLGNSWYVRGDAVTPARAWQLMPQSRHAACSAIVNAHDWIDQASTAAIAREVCDRYPGSRPCERPIREVVFSVHARSHRMETTAEIDAGPTAWNGSVELQAVGGHRAWTMQIDGYNALRASLPRRGWFVPTIHSQTHRTLSDTNVIGLSQQVPYTRLQTGTGCEPERR